MLLQQNPRSWWSSNIEMRKPVAGFWPWADRSPHFHRSRHDQEEGRRGVHDQNKAEGSEVSIRIERQEEGKKKKKNREGTRVPGNEGGVWAACEARQLGSDRPRT